METQEIRQHLATLEATPARLEAALKGVSKKRSLWSPAPGKWSILEIVCHLRDMEREAYLDRYRRILETPADGAGTGPSLPDIDGDVISLERDYRNARLSEVLREWSAVRKETLRFLRGVNADQWRLVGVHETAGRLTMTDLLLRQVAGNDEAHLSQIDAIKMRYELFERLSSMPARLAELLRGQSDDALDRKPGPGKWSAREIACHLRDIDRVYAERFTKMAFTQQPQFWMIDNTKLPELLRYREQDARAVLKEVRRRRKDLLGLLRALPHSIWQRTGVHPWRGELTLQQMAEVVASHDDSHLEQIRQALVDRDPTVRPVRG